MISMRQKSQPTAVRSRWAVSMGLYLLGIFMGAIDTGIVTPGRTVIQRDLAVDDQVGIWMITIYTLAYAAAIPVMGKLADRVGRKKIYLASILLFGVGSLLCGLSQDVGSFGMLVGARALQALGGGGILPIATAEIGTEVPEERRGLALGLVGAVYGIANIFGASAGSLILELVGVHNWQWIFYVNVPIAALIVVAGLAFLPDHREAGVQRIDIFGSLVLVAMILSLLYGIRNVDFFDLGESVRSASVWPYLVGFLVLLPVLVLVERRASDPVLNLRYFTDPGHALVLLLSLLSGVALMAVVFVPQFAENALRLKSGAGGYTVIVLGLASGIGAPLSGTLTDKFGPKRVLGFGAAVSLLAAAVTWVWTIPQPGLASVLTSLGLFGLGLGFVIGSPLNYMMLARTPKSESNSALATLSLLRSLGTTLAPAIMVGFLAQAGTLMQDRLTAELPTTVRVPALPYASELQAKFAQMKADDKLADQLKDVQLPDLGARDTIEIDPRGGGTLPDDLVELLRTADVTNITDRSKTVAQRMFASETPTRVAEITDGVRKGITSLDEAQAKLDSNEADMAQTLTTMSGDLSTMATSITDMKKQLKTMDGQITEMTSGIAGMDSAIAGMDQAIPGLQQGVSGMDEGIAQQKAALAAIEAQLAALSAGASTQPPATDPTVPPTTSAAPDPTAALTAQADALRTALADLKAQRHDAASQLSTLEAQRADVVSQREDLGVAREGIRTGRSQLATALAKLSEGRGSLTTARAELSDGHDEVVAAQADLAETRRKMTVLADAVPGAFDDAMTAYLAEVDARAPRLEQAFQSTLSEGFRGVFAVYGLACLLMLVILPLVPRAKQPD